MICASEIGGTKCTLPCERSESNTLYGKTALRRHDFAEAYHFFSLVPILKKMHIFLFSSKKVLDFRKKWYKMVLKWEKVVESGNKWV